MARPPGKIALFGGTFDPPHLGHLAIARAAVARCGLDRVVFIPCRQSPHKENRASATPEDRLEMLRLSTTGETWAEVSSVELDRDGPSYSWETAQSFAARHPGAALYWILGADQWSVIESWRRHERLRELLTFIVFPRNGIEPAETPGFRSCFIDFRHPASATRIRESLRKGETSPAGLHPSVAAYIEKRGLYRDAAS